MMMSKTTKTKVEKIHVEVRTWWDKINGNPYFSAKIYVNSEDVGLIPFGYGSDDHAIDEAADLLAREGYLPEGSGSPAWYFRENGIKFSQSIVPVLKRNVIAFSKGEI